MSHTTDPSHFDFTTGIIICILNGLLALPTTILNFLLILSILTTPTLRRPSYMMICALAVSDFGVGLLIQPLYITRKVTFMLKDYETYCLLLKTGNVAVHIICSPSFLIVTGIGLDRYLAISLKTSYNTKVTNKVVLKYLAFALAVAVGITTTRVHATKPKYMIIPAIYMCFILMIILWCYFKSLKQLRSIQQPISREDSTDTSNLPRVSTHRRVLSTLMMIVVSLFCCYIPFVSVVIVMAAFGRSREFMIAWEVSLTLLFLNSLTNPILHFSRLKELRQACVTVIKRS